MDTGVKEWGPERNDEALTQGESGSLFKEERSGGRRVEQTSSIRVQTLGIVAVNVRRMGSGSSQN